MSSRVLEQKIQSQLISLYKILAFYLADDIFFLKLNSPILIPQSPDTVLSTTLSKWDTNILVNH